MTRSSAENETGGLSLRETSLGPYELDLKGDSVALVVGNEVKNRFDALTELLEVGVDYRTRDGGDPARVNYRVAEQSDEMEYTINMDIKVVDDSAVTHLTASCVERLLKLLICPRYVASFESRL